MTSRGTASILFAESMTLLLVASPNSLAEPVYLDCALAGAKGSISFEVKLDENNGQVTHMNSGGTGFNATGFFSADEVIYKNDEHIAGTGVFVTRQYRISRIDLSVIHDFQMTIINDATKRETNSPVRASGKCTIKQVTARKF
jgi:hypothetical protein